MTLHMYGISLTHRPATNVDFNIEGVQIFSWTDHHRLHDWMEALYRRKGGRSHQLRGTMLVLSSEDLDDLLHLACAHYFLSPPEVGDPVATDKRLSRDLEFVDRARNVMNGNRTVVYCAWW